MTPVDFRHLLLRERAKDGWETVQRRYRLTEDQLADVCMGIASCADVGFKIVDAYRVPFASIENAYVLPVGVKNIARRNGDPANPVDQKGTDRLAWSLGLKPVKLVDTHSRSQIPQEPRVQVFPSDDEIERGLLEIIEINEPKAESKAPEFRPLRPARVFRTRSIKMPTPAKVAVKTVEPAVVADARPAAKALVEVSEPKVELGVVPAAEPVVQKPKTTASPKAVQLEMFADPNDHQNGSVIRHMRRKMRMSVELIADTLGIETAEIELVLAGKWKPPAPVKAEASVQDMVRRIGIRWTAVALGKPQKEIRKMLEAA